MQDSLQIPRHVVIIPDGNRRWAKKNFLPALKGHMEGYARTKELIKVGKECGVTFLTMWAFSTENWSRESEEVRDLLTIIHKGLLDLKENIHQEKVRFCHLGRKDRLTEEIVALIQELEETTKHYEDFCLSIAIDYGGEDEINRAEKELCLSGDASKSIRDFLDTTRLGIPDPECIIRTSGEQRTSGCMPLQSAYSEWIFEETLFPDFTENLFKQALEVYAKRVRRFGK